MLLELMTVSGMVPARTGGVGAEVTPVTGGTGVGRLKVLAGWSVLASGAFALRAAGGMTTGVAAAGVLAAGAIAA